MKIPKMAYYLLLFFIFRFVWSFYADQAETFAWYKVLLRSNELAIFFIIIIVYNTHFSDKFIKKSVFAIKITIMLAAIVSVIQVFNTDFLNAWKYLAEINDIDKYSMNIYTYRRTSIFGYIDPNAYGLTFIPMLSIIIGYSLYRKEKNLLLFILLGGLTAFLTNSRYVIIGFVIITFQIIIINKVKITGFFKYAVFILVGFFLLFQLLVSIGYNFSDWFNVRLFAEGSIQETTRYKAIENFMIFFPKAPWLGTGGMTEKIRSASAAIGSSQIHVGYLSLLTYYGVFGCIFLFGFWLLLIKKLYKTAKKTNYWGSFFAYLMFFWSFATMNQPSIFYYGLIFALVFDKYFTDSHNLALNTQQPRQLPISHKQVLYST